MSQEASSLLTNTLQAASALSSGPLEQVWKILVGDGVFFKEISLIATGFVAIFLSFQVIQFFLNRRRPADEQVSIGDAFHYIIITLILFCLVTPLYTGKILYGFHFSVHSVSDKAVASIAALNGDPNAAFAQIITAQQTAMNGVRTCDGIPDPDGKRVCLEDLKNNVSNSVNTSNGWGSNITNAVTGIISAATGNVVGVAASVVGAAGDIGSIFAEGALLTVITPILLLFGTAFLLILEISQLTSAILFPFVLLIGLYRPIYVLNWVKSFFSWGLIVLTYKILVSSIAFVMLSLDFANAAVYALVVGIFAPWSAYQVISGSSLGLLGAVGGLAQKAVR
jgi:hypothetical protein